LTSSLKAPVAGELRKKAADKELRELLTATGSALTHPIPFKRRQRHDHPP